MRRICIAAAIVLCSLSVTGSSWANDGLWFGGGIGFGFWTVDYVEVTPIVGFSATKKVSVGGGITYRYRDDGRYPGGLTTNDYGANVFARYRFLPSLFGHLEYEYLSYEFVRSDLSTDRDNFNSVLVGPGFHQPAGKRVSFFATALYNLSYDSAEFPSPYDDEWVFRVGVGVGF